MNTNPALEALTRLESYLAQDPGNDGLRAEAFEAALRAGRRDRAEAHLNEGLASGHDALAWRLRQAHWRMAEHDWDRAIGLLEALKDEPEPPSGLEETARHDLALIALRQGRVRDGLALLQPVVEEAQPAPVPEVQALWLRLVHQDDRLAEGVACAQRWASSQALAPEAAGVAALLAFDDGQMDLCRTWSQAALAREPRQMEALVTQGSLALGDQAADRAKALLGAALELNPQDGRALSAMAFAELLSGDLSRAQATFRQSLDAMPGHVGTWHGLGWVALLQGDLTSARAVFQHALDLDRNFAESHGGMATVLARQGDREGAAAAIAVALRLDRQCLSAHYAQAILDGRDKEAADLRKMANRIFAARRERSERE